MGRNQLKNFYNSLNSMMGTQHNTHRAINESSFAPRKILKQIHSFSFEFVKSVSTGEGGPSLLVKDSDNSDTSLGFLKIQLRK